MKTFSLILFVSMLTLTAWSQKIITKQFPYSADQTVNLNLKFADSIRVRYWDKAEVSVRISVLINGGRLNDGLTVENTTNAQEISLKTNFDNEILKKGKAEDCPDSKYTWRTQGDGQDMYVCSTIHYQVFLPRNAKLKLETINGNVDIQGAAAPVFAKSISGYIDYSLPKSKGANLAMKTITGEVYTDLDIDFKNKRPKNPIVGYLLEGSVNGGGPDIRLESISNNVYVRKKD